ncbi:MAG: hypothetical protein NWQ19_06600 [Nonlabens sp.]|nr:hypothetical protein [Nonlabens sp.]
MRIFLLLFFVVSVVLAQKENPIDASDRRDKLDTILLRPRITNADTLMSLVLKNYESNHDTAKLFMNFKHESSTIIQPQKLEIDLERTPSSKAKKKAINERLVAVTNELKKKPVKDYNQHSGVYNGQDNMGLFIKLKTAYTFDKYAEYTAIDELIPKVKKALGDEISQVDEYKVRSGFLPIDKNLKLVIDTATVQHYKDKDGKERTLHRDMRSSVLSSVHRIVVGKSYENGSRVNLTNANFYEYTLIDFIQTDSVSYYEVAFKPASRKGDFEGIFHIDATDFGILYLKYGYAPKRHGQKLNLKLLLGVKFNQPIFNEEVKYKKHDSGYYYPFFVTQHTWAQMYLHRPFQLKNLRTSDKYKFDFKTDVYILTSETFSVSNAEFNEDSKGYKVEGVKKYTVLN